MKNIAIPFSILVAGGMIAASVFFVNTQNKQIVQNIPDNTDTRPQALRITIPPITGADHIKGNPEAPIKIVEYSDTECPFCKNFHTTMHSIIDTYGKTGQVAWVYRHFPIASLHKKAHTEAAVTECVAQQKGEDAFWNILDDIYETTPSNDGLSNETLMALAQKTGVEQTTLNTCITSEETINALKQSVADATKAGASGTPYSVIITDTILSETQITALIEFNDNLTGGQGQQIIGVDTTDKNKVSVYGALPFDMMKIVMDIVTNTP